MPTAAMPHNYMQPEQPKPKKVIQAPKGNERELKKQVTYDLGTKKIDLRKDDTSEDKHMMSSSPKHHTQLAKSVSAPPMPTDSEKKNAKFEEAMSQVEIGNEKVFQSSGQKRKGSDEHLSSFGNNQLVTIDNTPQPQSKAMKPASASAQKHQNQIAVHDVDQ